MRNGMMWLTAALLLTGCSDAQWRELTTFDEVQESPPATVSPAAMPTPAKTELRPVSQPSTPDFYCQRVATSHAQQQAQEGFDTATQRRTAEIDYRQCMDLSGGAQ